MNARIIATTFVSLVLLAVVVGASGCKKDSHAHDGDHAGHKDEKHAPHAGHKDGDADKGGAHGDHAGHKEGDKAPHADHAGHKDGDEAAGGTK